MARLRIVADGETDPAKANARGKLFEKISAEVLGKYGYVIDEHRPNITYAGMEIDIEGHHGLTGDPLYAECKCYSSDVDCPKLQAFMGKYTARWFKNKKASGIFLAIPGLNTNAMGYYKDNCQDNNEITIELFQEPRVIELLIKSQIVVSEQEIAGKIDKSKAEPGDSILICSDKGYFWLRFVIPHGSGIATSYQLFDGKGHLIKNQDTIDYLAGLVAELIEFDLFNSEQIADLEKERISDEDSIVELRGSSSCFEYQFPASPEYFVGRTAILEEVNACVTEVLENRTSCRGILFEGNSGWGKSSAVLATVDKLKKMGHYAIAIDSRCANSSRFVLSIARHVLDTFDDFDGAIDEIPSITGFQGAVDSLAQIGEGLKRCNKVLFIFLDQFEIVFNLSEVLKKLSVMLLKLTDRDTNVVLGFSWKTDLLGMTRDFPYQLRDSIVDSCKVCHLSKFTDVETNGLLDKLSQEMGRSLRKDLRFLLSEFSQGYPWLLKKLCAHAKKQRETGVQQAEIAKGLLNVDQLFQEDLQGLSPEEEGTLKRIAKLAPVQALDIGDDLNKDIIRSLIDRRLVVKVGAKYDIYWDIFRDYLNTGHLPIEEIYLLRSNFGSCVKSLNILNRNKGQTSIEEFKHSASLSDGACLNVLRDLKLLKLAETENRSLNLFTKHSDTEKEFFLHISQHIFERLKKNHSVNRVLKYITECNDVTIEQLAAELASHFPYISASSKTWKTYANTLAHWLDLADLAIYDSQRRVLSKYDPNKQIRERTLTFARRRRQSPVPAIQFNPVLQVAQKIIAAIENKKTIDWSDFKKTTVLKSLSMLEDMKLISRKGKSISISLNLIGYASNKNERIAIAKNTLLQWPLFARFMAVLRDNESIKMTHEQLADTFIKTTGVEWSPSSAKTEMKIMLDWARHLNIAPGKFAHTHRGPFKKKPPDQPNLFDR